MNLVELIVLLRIEEDNKKTERIFAIQFRQAKANLVESSSRINKKRKLMGDAPKTNNNKSVKMFKGNCYNYEKIGPCK